MIGYERGSNTTWVAGRLSTKPCRRETYQPTSTMRWDNWDRGIDSGYLSWIICLKQIGQIYDQVF